MRDDIEAEGVSDHQDPQPLHAGKIIEYLLQLLILVINIMKYQVY